MRARVRGSGFAWLVGGVVVIASGCSNGAGEPGGSATPSGASTPVEPKPVEPKNTESKQVKPKPAKPVEPAEASNEALAPTPVASRPGKGGERLNPEVAGLGTEVMLAALPERVGAWTRTASKAHPAGSAGRWADGATATYRECDREIHVDVSDMIRADACTPGTGASIAKESLAANRTSKRVELGKHPAVLAPGSPGASIGLWLGDRCQLGLSSSQASADEVVALGSALGLDALAAACAKRDPASLLGP